MKYFIVTYGCQMNYSDSERIAAILKSAKIMPGKSIKEADLLIINSCSVRQSAINRIYGQLINFKKMNKTGKTILTGCILETDKKKFKDKFDLIIDIKELTNPRNNELNKLLKFINPKASEREFKAFDYTDYFKINPQYRSNFSAYIPIMTGCNNFCSYCAVPYTRGREISRPTAEITTEVKKLVKKGYKEITLLGQNVNSYISQVPNPKLQILNKSQIPNSKSQINTKTIKFPELLKLINDIPGDFQIRIMSPNPKNFSDELINVMAKSKRMAKYLNLPVQSGDNQILKRMNRPYKIEQYKKLVRKIREKIPNINLSTDVIVGFPGETKEQFENTAKLFKEIKFNIAYISKYSPRPGTVAFKMNDNVPFKEKERRWEILNNIILTDRGRASI